MSVPDQPRYRQETEFGYSNDPANLLAVRAIVAAAVADGWSIRPTYEREPVERAAHLERDGFTMSALMRDNTQDAEPHHWKYEVDLSLWGPDKLMIPPPETYDSGTFARLIAMLRHCPHCKAEDVDTFCYSFAGRCCAACLPEMKAEHEKPGWYN